jgi:hypothetical protein
MVVSSENSNKSSKFMGINPLKMIIQWDITGEFNG